MSQGRIQSSFLLLDNQNVLTSPNSQAIRLRDVAGLSITLDRVSGTVAGVFKLQASDFGVTDINPPTVWVDVPSSTQAWAGSPLGWNVTDINAKWFRIVFTDSGSAAPAVTAWCTLKRYGGEG